MPKIRGVKPEFWTDDAIVDLSIPARLLFIGLWNYACDNGHLDDKPKQIKMRILPADDVNVGELLDELEAHSRINRKGGTITIPKFAAHQRPHKRWWTTCDKPGCVIPPDAPPQGRNGGTTVEQPLHNGSATVTDVTDVDVDSDSDTDAGADRADVLSLCEHLATRIQGNGSRAPKVGKTWHKAGRLLIDSDKRDPEEAHRLIDWCQDSTFWQSNILSMAKFREKYDQLRLQSQQSSRFGGSKRATGIPEGW